MKRRNGKSTKKNIGWFSTSWNKPVSMCWRYREMMKLSCERLKIRCQMMHIKIDWAWLYWWSNQSQWRPSYWRCSLSNLQCPWRGRTSFPPSSAHRWLRIKRTAWIKLTSYRSLIVIHAHSRDRQERFFSTIQWYCHCCCTESNWRWKSGGNKIVYS